MGMDSRMVLVVVLLGVILAPVSAKIYQMGYLNTSQTVQLGFNSTNPADCREYMFETNYKKVLFELITIPTSDAKYKQRIILSDMQFAGCPQRCSEEPNYCTAISNRLYAKTEAMFSKCFPTLYVYVVNQQPKPLNMISNEEIDRNSDDIEVKTTQLVESEMTSTDKYPIFKLTPSHLDSGCKIINSIVPQCASLSLRDCIDPYFCTTDCSLLTCNSQEGSPLFSLCAASDLTPASLHEICTAHSKFHQNYTLSACENPNMYNPSLPETAASLLLLCLCLMIMMISCVCCYNLRLTKTNEAPCETCPFCPECLFPRPIEDNPLYQEDENDFN